MSNKELLDLRKKIKRKKPSFTSQDSHKRARINKKWRRPKGWQSKIRLNKRGYRKKVSPGYGSPKKIYGLHPAGLKPVLISSMEDIEKLDPKNEGAIIAKTTGQKKRVQLIKKAREKDISILNVKDPAKFIKQVEEKFRKKQEKKKEKEAEKSRKKKEQEEKSRKETQKSETKKDELGEKVSEEVKKEEEKKEKDKLLTRKES